MRIGLIFIANDPSLIDLHRLGINLVVLCVSPQEAYEHDLPSVIDLSDETVIVPLDVKDDSVMSHEVNRSSEKLSLCPPVSSHSHL